MSAKRVGPHLSLPDSAREAMRVPLGPVVQDAGLGEILSGAGVLVGAIQTMARGKI